MVKQYVVPGKVACVSFPKAQTKWDKSHENGLKTVAKQRVSVHGDNRQPCEFLHVTHKKEKTD